MGHEDYTDYERKNVNNNEKKEENNKKEQARKKFYGIFRKTNEEVNKRSNPGVDGENFYSNEREGK